MQRQRPLQNSMFLPDHRRQSMEYNVTPTIINKNSSGFSNMESVVQEHRNMMLQPRFNIPHFEPFGLSQNNQSTEKSMNEINQKLEKLTKMVDKHEIQLGSKNYEAQLSQRVLQEVKQFIPVIVSNDDVYENIFNLKLDLKMLREEVSQIPKIADMEKIAKVQGRNGDISKNLESLESSRASSSNGQIINSQYLKKRDDFFQSLIKNLETEVSMLKKYLNNMGTQMKVSPISSSSCIMLKYQQLFKARTKGETDMIINEHTYYIDNEGYLLDCHSRYIVDQKGKKVRLEQKHLTMLRNQRILQ